MLNSVRLGVANEYQGLFLLDIIQEILMGTQEITHKWQNMGLLKENMINVITNGHMPLLAHVAIDLASTDEWQQKAVADACTAVALGWLVHIAPVPSITGSDVVVKTLTETTETLGLGKVVVELDAEKTIQIYVDHIEKKRKELGLN
ncbi:MAG: hypothetical protein ACYDG2_05580 [Ruminiclostridium sp.]